MSKLTLFFNYSKGPLMSVTDYSQLPAQCLVSLINDANGTTITPAQVTFGTPAPINGLRNTEIVVTSVPASLVPVGTPALPPGSVALTYNRLNIDTIPGVRNRSFSNRGVVNISDLLPQINKTYGINLTLADINDAPLPLFVNNIPNETIGFELVAAPGSLVFIGSTVLKLINTSVQLSAIITNTVLNGFIYIQPVTVTPATGP